MKKLTAFIALAILAVAGAAQASGKVDPAVCNALGIRGPLNQPLRPQLANARNCTLRSVDRDGVSYPMADPGCTPGADNPTVTTAVLTDARFRTSCVRNTAETEQAKGAAYDAYGVQKEGSGNGEDQLCELDHLVPLELGGADTMNNIWPQCGRTGQGGEDRYFKLKDMVENYLAAGVKSGGIPQRQAQVEIARDWTQFLEAAQKHCHGTTCTWGP